jgi:hypothetical protein
MAIENSGDVTEDHLDVHISVYLHFLHNTLSDLAFLHVLLGREVCICLRTPGESRRMRYQKQEVEGMYRSIMYSVPAETGVLQYPGVE